MTTTTTKTPAPADCGRCTHPGSAHDAGECWADRDGEQCTCSWYTPFGSMPDPATWDYARARYDALKKYDNLPGDVQMAIDALGKLVNAYRSEVDV